jgi:cholesterol oxidase
MTYDYVIIGSGFGGSVSALRLSEKGYKVLVIEKGKWHDKEDFPERNWNLKKWLWIPLLKFHGILKITIFKHVGILSGVGVGGGSLVYANTLPVPGSAFFNSGSWANLSDWESELKPYYKTAKKMLGANKTPELYDGDLALKELASQIKREEQFSSTDVGVFFGKPNETVPDPYFDGKGPERTGCTHCGACMTGCRVGAKNTLDKNYLFLAQQLGAEVLAEKEVFDIEVSENSENEVKYTVHLKDSTRFFKTKTRIRASGVIFSGGVLGTVPLLMRLKKRSLPNLSKRIGHDIRINNETLVTVAATDYKKDYSKGVAIGSILHTDANSHLEICRYGKGSGFWKISHVPFVTGKNGWIRFLKMIKAYLVSPLAYFKTYWNGEWSKRSVILLFMQTIDTTLKFRSGRSGGVNTALTDGLKPSADIPESTELTKRYADITGGKPMAFYEQTLLGKASTAHILGGAVMGKSKEEGVIDKENQVFGYENMFVIDGSMISANPGVNPSLTITAIAEHAMNSIPNKIS